MTTQEAIKEMQGGKLITNKTIWQSTESDYYWMDIYGSVRYSNGKIRNETVEDFVKFMNDEPFPYDPNKWELYGSE